MIRSKVDIVTARIIIILLLAGTMISCTEKYIFSSNNEEEQTTYTTGCLQIFLENPDLTTRAGWEYDDYFPSSDIRHADTKIERWLHNLSLAYFDSNFLLEHFDSSINYSNDSGIATNVLDNPKNTSGEFSVFTLGVGNFPLTTGAHYFYILCNLPPEALDKLKAYCQNKKNILTKDEFEKITYSSEACISELTAIYSTNNPTEGIVYKPRCAMSNIVSPAPHYMADRTLGAGGYPATNGISMKIGKAFAKVSVAYIGNNEILENVEYRIVNDPKELYMLPNVFNGQIYTPHYDKEPQEDFVTYFEENFNPESHIKSETTNEGLEIDAEDTPLYQKRFSWRKAITNKNGVKTYAYCMENANKTPLQGNSTMVLVKGKYNPQSWLDKDGKETNAASSDGTFWRIKNDYGYLEGYYNEKPEPRNKKQQVIEYNKGITYYPIWITTDGNYMVKRNHYYKIAITDIISAGEPDTDNVIDPKKPLTANKLETRSNSTETNIPEVTRAIRWEQNN